MNKKIFHIFIVLMLFFNASNVFSQEKKIIGKVVAKTRDLQGVHVKNISSDQSTLTDRGGYFSILAQPNDTLIFTAIHLVGREKILTFSDMNKSLVFVPMEFLDNIMDELVIDRRITAEGLGLGGGTRMTPAQRKLHTATSSSGSGLLVLPVDAIINAISGRTKMLKKALELEKEDLMVQDILNKFPEDYYSNHLKIPLRYHKAFGYFMAQDPLILASYKNSESTELSILYVEKAVEFLEILEVLK